MAFELDRPFAADPTVLAVQPQKMTRSVVHRIASEHPKERPARTVLADALMWAPRV